MEALHPEAQTASMINHTNVVDLTDFGTIEGHPYLVMEFRRRDTPKPSHRDRFRHCASVESVLKSPAASKPSTTRHRPSRSFDD